MEQILNVEEPRKMYERRITEVYTMVIAARAVFDFQIKDKGSVRRVPMKFKKNFYMSFNELFGLVFPKISESHKDFIDSFQKWEASVDFKKESFKEGILLSRELQTILKFDNIIGR